MKQKYYIIPKKEIIGISIAKNPKEAIQDFASIMDRDMSAYFKAVTDEELQKIKLEKSIENGKRDIMDFMINELTEQFKVDNDTAKHIAHKAYKIYTSGDYDLTQYDCINKAFNEWKEQQT